MQPWAQHVRVPARVTMPHGCSALSRWAGGAQGSFVELWPFLQPQTHQPRQPVCVRQTYGQSGGQPDRQMAKAGFVHCPSQNEPDVVRCFFCLIELEGWEPDDDPWAEHIKRSPTCGFLTMTKDFTSLTVAEFYQMEKDRIKIYLRKVCNKKMAHLQDEIDSTVASLTSKLDSI